jgi:hypothetical protein
VQILGDGRQRYIGDRAVHHGHNQAQRYGENGPVALRQRDLIFLPGNSLIRWYGQRFSIRHNFRFKRGIG